MSPERMKWGQFRSVAFPNSQALAEAKRSAVWRANRWLGLRFAYCFYWLGLSANAISLLRIGTAALGFFMLSLVAQHHRWLPAIGALLLALQINLDYADGPIARVHGTSSHLGEKLDGAANAASRFAVVALSGFLSQCAVGFIIAIFAAYVLVVLLPDSGVKMKSTGGWRFVDLVYRIALYVPVMVFFLPSVLALHGVFGWDAQAFGQGVTYTYAFLAVLWFPVYVGRDHPGHPNRLEDRR